MTTFILRPARLTDIEEAVPMLNLCSQKEIGADEHTSEECYSHWTYPGFNIEHDMRVAISATGELVGVATMWNNKPPHVLNWVWGRVHPNYEGQGIGTAMLEWAEKRAYEKLPLAEADTCVTLRGWCYANSIEAKRLYESLGYSNIRYSFLMECPLDAAMESPTLPDGIVIRPMIAPDEYIESERAILEAFRDHWGFVERPLDTAMTELMHHIQTTPDHDPTLWFVAMDGDHIAGTARCDLKTTDDPTAGYVDVLAVRREYRKRGIGLALLLHSFAELYRRGQRKARLGVDAGNLTGALRLYERAGMHVTRQEEIYEKEVRPGRDLTMQG